MTSESLQTRSTLEQEQLEPLQYQVQHLLVALETILRQSPSAHSELTLIRTLQARPWNLIGDVDYSDPARLFPVHFLLFHSLYRLRDELSPQGWKLDISPLSIRLQPTEVVGGQGLPDHGDTLRSYYLDLNHCLVSDDAVYQMMDAFWSGQSQASPAHDELRMAAEVLGFEAVPTELPPVKQRFRREVMKAHPDRGGNVERVQELNHAFAVFKTHIRDSR